MHDQRGSSLIAVVLVLAIGGFVAWYGIDMYLQASAAAIGDADGAPLDETKRRRTIADMRTIGKAIELMRVDAGAAPSSLALIEAGGYLAKVPTTDAWGNAFAYSTGNDGFTLVSLGADGRSGPPAPTPWQGGAYDADLILMNGQLTQAPGER